MKPRSVAALSYLLICSVLLSSCGVLGGSSAACGQTIPSLKPSRAAPGETFVLSGGGFREGCNDTGPPFFREPPRKNIRIEMRQEGKTWGLATVDADADYRIDETLWVPKDAESGKALVVVNDKNVDPSDPLAAPFRVLGGRSG